MHSLYGTARDRTWDFSIPSRTFYHCSTATPQRNIILMKWSNEHRLRTVKNAFVSGMFSLFSADDIETICGLFVRTSSASSSSKSSDVWQYCGPLYCEYRTRLKFIGYKSCPLVLFLGVRINVRASLMLLCTQH